MPKRIVPIKYTSRDFDSIKGSLVDYIKRYYPDTFKDFNEAGFGALMLDTVSYIGDVLSFYLDYQANESFLDTAVEYDNIIRLGKQFGYKFRANPSSFGLATLYILVPSNASGTAPDDSYKPILKKGSQFQSKGGINFILDEDVRFDHPNLIPIAARQDDNGTTHWAIKSYGKVVSGSYTEEIVEVGAHHKFLRIPLSTINIADVLSIVDDEGHNYYEVEYLSQDVIYKAVTNRNPTSDSAPAILKPFMVPRRFVVEREQSKTYIQFGGGSDLEFNSDNTINPSIVDPANIVLRRHGASFISDSSFDPYKLVASDEFGIAPSNTTLRVVMRVNTASDVNVSTNSLENIQEATFEFKDLGLSSSTIVSIQNSLEVTNEEPIVGDITLPDATELKRRILDSFATQNRAVTAKDYEAMAYSMPPQFGAVKRCKIIRDHGSMRRNLNMYVISEDSTGYLAVANNQIKENLKTWLTKNKMINDTIDILDAKVINLSINFEAVGRADTSKYETIEAANTALRNHFKRIPEVGEPFWITDVYKVLKDIESIVDVNNVNISLKIGGIYSSVDFDVEKNTSPDGRYIEIPRNCIVEIKRPQDDIKGVVK